MNLPNSLRAEVIIEALPYIKKYNGKVVVIKYGGNAMINEELKEQVMEDIVLLSLIGVQVVLVHGGGPEITEMMDKVGKQTEWVDGLRVTDKESTEIVQMVLAGKINKSLVNLLETKGGKAMGICGIDGQMIKAEMKDKRLGYVGKITEVNVEPILDLIEKGYTPVVSTLGCDNDGNVYNINADTAAAHIAGAVGADRFFLMTDIEGILRDKNDCNSLISLIDIKEAEELTKQGII
ncbi:MAG: acetylglutamate kinase, partial [Clostridia bacterium]|nr:acetylglutamate kinase [Clostridia bacterium]